LPGALGLSGGPRLGAGGGFWTQTVGGAFDPPRRRPPSLRAGGEPYRVAFIPDPVCWTQAPEQLQTLARQRRRWQRGLWEGLRRHQRMIANPRYGIVGVVAMPYFAVFEFLSPVFALLGLVVTFVWWSVGGLSPLSFAAFLAVSLGLGVVFTTAALALEEFSYRRYTHWREILRLLAYSVLENIGYHQLHDIWRSMAYVDIAR